MKPLRSGFLRGLRPPLFIALTISGFALAGCSVPDTIGGAAEYSPDPETDRLVSRLGQELTPAGIEVHRSSGGIKVIIPGAISFQSGQGSLTHGIYPLLQVLGRTLRERQGAEFLVTGHTDASGSESANQLLSEQRAESVAAFLATQGIARARIHVRGCGARQPVADNATAEGKAANRRLEIDISGLSS